MSEEEKKAIEWVKNNLEETIKLGQKYGLQDAIKYQTTILNLIENQQKEIEEKTTILLAGAEKVKQLEKGNRSLMESRIKWKNRYYKEKDKNKKCISKDKIREFIKEELPDDEIMKWNIIYDVNGIDLRIKLEKMLEEN